jgi:hypothetical protein
MGTSVAALDRSSTACNHPPHPRTSRGWIAYVVAWLAAALFWTMAATSTAGARRWTPSRLEELRPVMKNGWAAALEHGGGSPRVQLLRAMTEVFVPPQYGGNPERGMERWKRAIALFEQEQKTAISGAVPRWATPKPGLARWSAPGERSSRRRAGRIGERGSSAAGFLVGGKGGVTAGPPARDAVSGGVSGDSSG